MHGVETPVGRSREERKRGEHGPKLRPSTKKGEGSVDSKLAPALLPTACQDFQKEDILKLRWGRWVRGGGKSGYRGGLGPTLRLFGPERQEGEQGDLPENAVVVVKKKSKAQTTADGQKAGSKV